MGSEATRSPHKNTRLVGELVGGRAQRAHLIAHSSFLPSELLTENITPVNNRPPPHRRPPRPSPLPSTLPISLTTISLTRHPVAYCTNRYGLLCSKEGSELAAGVFASVPKLEGRAVDGDELDLDAVDEDDDEKDGLDLTALLSLGGDDGDGDDAGVQVGVGGTFATSATSAMSPATTTTIAATTVYYEDAFLRLYVEDLQKSNVMVGFTARYEAAPSRSLSSFRVQAAVPKQMKLKLDPQSGTSLGAGVGVTQRMTIQAADGASAIGDSIVMKVRLNFESDGDKVVNVAEIRM